MKQLLALACLGVLLSSCGGDGLQSMSRGQVEKLCMERAGLAEKPSGRPEWDDTEWSWTGTVRLSDARPSAQFVCVVTGEKAEPQVSVTTR